MPGSRKHPILQPISNSTIAVVSIALTFLLRQYLFFGLGLELYPFILAFPVIVVVALRLGLWPGILAATLETLLAEIWFFPPTGHFKLNRPADAIAVALFLAASTFICVVINLYHRNKLRLAILESEHALNESRVKLETALRSMTDAVFMCDAEGRLIHFNQAFADFHRFPSAAEVATRLDDYPAWIEVQTGDGQPLPLEMWPVARALRGESVANAEFILQRRGTGERWIGSYTVNPICDQNGGITGVVGCAHDMTESKRSEDALRSSEERYRSAFQTSLDIITITTLDEGRYIDVNHAFLEALGYERHEVIGRCSDELHIWANPLDRESLAEKLCRERRCRELQVQFRRKNGEIFWGLLSSSLLDLDGKACILTFTRDITDSRRADEEIRTLAFFDTLTGLANRRLLMERLGQSIAFSARNHLKRALLFIDLDNFKLLNDTLGHQAGDLLLREVAQRLQACVRDIDTVGRLGGDEFVVILEDLDTASKEAATRARSVAQKILDRVAEPYSLNGHDCFNACSIGIAIFGGQRDSVNEVLQKADIAMYQAKAAGRNTIRFFAASLQAAVNTRVRMEEELRQGIRNNQFVLYYQPQIHRGRVTGAEALLRWRHPRLGILTPGTFIGLAEETQLILPLGAWILESACRQIAAWAGHQPTANIKVAVNISALQLRKDDFVDSVLSALDRAGANPRHLRLELTESMLVHNFEEVVTKMTALKQYGVNFALDDFGTGYSSLAYLKRLPLEQLKIPLNFVRDIQVDASSGAIAQTIIALGRALKLSVLAEGVETEEQRNFLASLGCDSYQGFLFSRPIPAQAFESLLHGIDQKSTPVKE